MIRLSGEDPGRLTRRNPTKLGDDDLHDEVAAGPEVIGCVRDHRELLVLRRHVHDAVRDHVDQRELTRKPGGRHVADREGDRVGTRLRAELLGHGRRQLDPLDVDPSPTERQRDPPGSRTELDDPSAPCQLREKVSPGQ
jgi:hypothetical protein